MRLDAAHEDDLGRQVRQLRRAGRSVKQIAKATGESPRHIVSLLNAATAADRPRETDPDVAGCWVSPGWSIGLTVTDHPEWRDGEDADEFSGGMAAVLVARTRRTHRVSVCGYLVDTYCLGVKNALGPREMSDRDLPAFVRTYFGGFEQAGPPLRVPLDMARHLVFGGVDAARRLGFEPHQDFAQAAEHLGSWESHSAITFGCDGVPTYIAGPYDDGASVIATLTRSVGEGNFSFTAPVAGADGGSPAT